MFFVIFAMNYLVQSQHSFLLVHGPKTPLELKSTYNSTFSLFLSSTSNVIDFSSIVFPSFILDISLDPSLFSILDSMSNYFRVPYLTITKTPDFQYSSNRFFVLPPNSQEARALVAIIHFFDWQKFAVISSNIEENLNIVKILSDSFSGVQMKKYIYDRNITEENLDVFIKRLVKVTGVKNLVVLDKGKSLEMCIKLIKMRKMEEFGNYFLFGLGNFNAGIEGGIELALNVGVNASSDFQFYKTVINHVISKLTTFTFNDFEKTCNQNICLKDFIIVNIQNGKKLKVGTIEQSIKIIEQMVFPGNNTNIKTENFKKKLPIMIANGTSEPNNMTVYKTSYIFKGAHYAAELANLDKDIEDFEYVFIPTDCGNRYYNLSWCSSCISKYSNNLGLAYITGFWDQSAMANIISLQSLNIFIPQISAFSYMDLLNNKTIYPELLKMVEGVSEYILNVLIMYKFFNWNDFILVIGKGTFNMGIYQTLIEYYPMMGMKFINSEENRFFPENYTRDDFSKYMHLFEYIRDSKCRLVLIFTTSFKYILEGLYDVGLRRGDIIVITSIFSFYDTNDETNEIFRKKQLEILDGAIIVVAPEYNSNNGKIIEKELKKRYSPDINMCINFDTFLTISNSIKYLINKGEDFEDPHKLIDAMRNVRFTGCSGDVFFKENENSRVIQSVDVCQIVVNSTTNDFEFRPFLSVSRFSVLAVRQSNKPIWATGEDSTPTNYREASYCVYSKYKQDSKYGLLQLHLASIILLIITTIVAYKSQNFFDNRIPELEGHYLFSYQDMLYQFFFICEFFQILALDPQTGIISQLSRGYNYFAGLDIVSFYNLENKTFWKFQILLISLALLYSCITSLSILFLRETMKIKSYFEIFIENFLPFIGHFGYMSIILMFMNIYKCEEGLTDTLTDSFISRDCAEYCYRGKHLTYVILSSVSLIMFLIISTFLRPFWQAVQTGLRLRTKASYLSILSISQLFLILLKVNIEPYSKVISGYLIFGSLLYLIYITFKMKPFNYEKVFWYQITFIVMDSWAILVSTTFTMVTLKKYSELTLIIGSCLIYFVGFKLSGHSREVFTHDEPNLIPDLIKFQFSPDRNRVRPESKYRASDGNENIKIETLNYHSTKYYRN